MIVYIESNFVFELGLGRQEQHHCATLLEWSAARRIELRLPAFAIPESRQALRRRAADRLLAIRALKTQNEDARRHSSADIETYDSAERSLRAWTEREAAGITAMLVRLYRQVTFISLDLDTLTTAELFRAVKVLNGDGDLLMFASVVHDLEQRKRRGDTAPSLFVTGDTDFERAKPYLRPYSCDLLTSYSAAVARLKGLR